MRGRKPNKPVGTGGDAPDAPLMSDDAEREWDRVMQLLVEGGVVQRVDQAIVAAYCETVVLWRRLSHEVAIMEIGDKKPAQYTMWLETTKQLRGLCDQLAFTPAARNQIIAGAPRGNSLEDALAG